MNKVKIESITPIYFKNRCLIKKGVKTSGEKVAIAEEIDKSDLFSVYKNKSKGEKVKVLVKVDIYGFNIIFSFLYSPKRLKDYSVCYDANNMFERIKNKSKYEKELRQLVNEELSMSS